MRRHADREALSVWKRRHGDGIGRLTVLLLALGAFLIVPPLLPLSRTTEFVIKLLLAVVAVSAALEIGRRRALFVLASSLAVVTVAAIAASLIWPSSGAGRTVAELMMVLLLCLLIWKVAQDVARAERVTGDVLRGTIAIYLLVGISWAGLYRMTETLRPGSFDIPEAAAPAGPGDETVADLRLQETFRYYSFVTLTTLGYGDITPRTRAARTLSWLEAVFGQLYIAITVAGLVALHIAHREKHPGKE